MGSVGGVVGGFFRGEEGVGVEEGTRWMYAVRGGGGGRGTGGGTASSTLAGGGCVYQIRRQLMELAGKIVLTPEIEPRGGLIGRYDAVRDDRAICVDEPVPVTSPSDSCD